MRILNRQATLGKLNFALLLAALCGCGTAPRTLILAGGAQSAAALLAAHPPEVGRNITPYLLEQDSYSSRHLIWVRDREQPHAHATHDLSVVVLRGQGTLWLGDREVPMAEGDIAVIPAGAPHAFVNTGTEPSAAFAVFSPPSDGKDVVPVEK